MIILAYNLNLSIQLTAKSTSSRWHIRRSVALPSVTFLTVCVCSRLVDGAMLQGIVLAGVVGAGVS